ncbi:tyrosine-type recombinase/integrase [Sutterella sp.]|uniref:tyrosine-type recombinase/integrase n=1 Tax=Sutterella sp. TaxID=1981025 RepID=UPI0026E106F7|nr:tyrosine-type recombinase/integrase [Sutterella sp.]MDO5532890.1 tyrosine-type recombinase/integrase [Sutterella sp.]
MSSPNSAPGLLVPEELPARRLAAEDELARLLPADWAVPLTKAGLVTLEDLYDCAASLGPNWHRSFPGLGAERAAGLMAWLAEFGRGVGEVTPRFYPAGKRPGGKAVSAAAEYDELIRPLEEIVLPDGLSGATGINRAPAVGCALSATDDLEAIRTWLNARAGNPNTFASYRKESERFLLWCLAEKRTALSDIRADDAAQYLRWLEDLGRLEEAAFRRKWRVPQARWIGEKNAERQSAAWRPFNGPLSPSSRRNAIVVVRQLFNFLKRTGYLIFNPFDQVSPKVPLLKGEGAPQAFADRSLTPAQWEDIVSRLDILPEGLPRERMKLILMMGKSLGMRASEMLDARAGWIVERRVGLSVRPAIEIVGKGSKVRRLPLSPEQIGIIESALAERGIPSVSAADPETPLLINLGRGRNPNGPMSRSGLYRVLEGFFDRVADDIATEAPMDAAKLRASSTHWLRHTFAVQALTEMSVNVVQAAMGHASVATTGRYLSPEEEEMSEAMARMKAL